jgi:hypothetical protein
MPTRRFDMRRLRNQIFYSLAELRIAIAALITRLNDERVLRQFGRTRRQLFEELDAPLLTPIPPEPWIQTEWLPDVPAWNITLKLSVIFTRCRTVMRAKPLMRG